MQNKEVRNYRIGNLSIGYEGPQFNEKEYISKFRIEENQFDLYYRMIQKDKIAVPKIPCMHRGEYIDVFQKGNEEVRIIYAQNGSQIVMKDVCNDGRSHLVEFDEQWMRNWGTSLMLKLFDLPHQLISREAVFLHASYVLWKGKAILFTAPKQTGKSTQAKLWETYRKAKIINGDRALLRKQDGGWKVYGSPYCGTSKICENVTSPLGAIVILSQAEANRAYMAATIEAFSALMEGFTFQTWNKEEVYKVTDLASDLVRNIPILKLECLPDKGAVEILEEMLW